MTAWTYEELEASHDVLLKHLTEQTEKVRILQKKLTDNRKKLDPREVELIRQMYRSGMSQKDIADIYDVNPATISRTVRNIYH